MIDILIKINVQVLFFRLLNTAKKIKEETRKLAIENTENVR